MKAVAEIQVVPIGVGVSVRAEVRRAQAIIRESGLEVQEHSFGTNVEGDLDTILQVIARIHQVLHAEGALRLSTAIKLGTRTDKEPDLASKLRDPCGSRRPSSTCGSDPDEMNPTGACRAGIGRCKQAARYWSVPRCALATFLATCDKGSLEAGADLGVIAVECR